MINNYRLILIVGYTTGSGSAIHSVIIPELYSSQESAESAARTLVRSPHFPPSMNYLVVPVEGGVT